MQPKVTGTVHYCPETRVLTGRADNRTWRKYLVDVLADHPAIPGPAMTLTVLDDDGTVFRPRTTAHGFTYFGDPWVYTVANTETGLTCTCGDFEFRRANEEFPCKHVAYLVAAGLMEGKS